jgi:WD40 repeat protein
VIVMPDYAKAELAWTLPWDAEWVTAVTFLGSSRRIAAGNNRGDLMVWELPEKPGAAPPPALRLEGHTNSISRLIATADGKRLYSASYDKTIRVWDLTAKPDGKATVVLNERARQEASRRRGGKVPAAVEVAVPVSKASKELTGHRDWVTALALSKDEKTLISGDDASAVVVWDAAGLKEVRRWPLKGWAYAIALSPDAKQAVVSERIPLIFDSGRRDGVTVWDVSAGKPLREWSAEFKGQHLSAAAWHPDGKTVFLGRGGEADGKKGVYALDVASGKKKRTYEPGHQEGITDLALAPDGKHLASCGRDTTVKVWEIDSGKLVATLGKPRGGQFKDWFHAVALSPDQQWVAVADISGRVYVWGLG